MGFKVGDKVKIIHNSNGSELVKQVMNKIGIIVAPYNALSDSKITCVEFDEEICGSSVIGFFEGEIEKVNISGQLLFPFMSEAT